MTSRIDATTPQLEVVDKMFEAYTTCDINNAAPFLSKDFTYQTLPKVADLPDETKGEHFEHYGPKFASTTKLEHVFHEVIEAPGKVVVHWTSLHTLPDGTTLDYDSLTIITLVEEDGKLKILEFKDFSDPEKRRNFHKAMSQVAQIA